MVNWIKLAAWSGVLIGVLFIFNYFFGYDFSGYVLIDFTIITIFSVLFNILYYYGFFILGKKYKIRLLKGMAIYFILFSIVLSILSIPLVNQINDKLSNTLSDEKLNELESEFQKLNVTYGGVENIPKEILEEKFKDTFSDFGKALLPLVKILIIGYFVFLVFYGIPSILFGVSLLKLGRKVKYSKVAGILNIIGGALTVILIGYLIIFVAVIFEIILLFGEARKIKRA